MLSRSLLPATEKTVLLTVVVALSACLSLAALALTFLLSQRSLIQLATDLILAVILLAIAVGLWRLNPIARGATVFLLWITLVLDGILWLAAHNSTGGVPPSEIELARRLWPAIVAVPVLIAALRVLGKYKADFRRKGAQQSGNEAT